MTLLLACIGLTAGASPAQALYVPYPHTVDQREVPDAYAPEDVALLSGEQCVGFNANGYLSNICGKAEVERIWYRVGSDVCASDGPFSSDAQTLGFKSLPLRQQADGTWTTPGGRQVDAISYIDTNGVKQTHQYNSTAGKDQIICTASLRAQADRAAASDTRQAVAVILVILITTLIAGALVALGAASPVNLLGLTATALLGLGMALASPTIVFLCAGRLFVPAFIGVVFIVSIVFLVANPSQARGPSDQE